MLGWRSFGTRSSVSLSAWASILYTNAFACRGLLRRDLVPSLALVMDPLLWIRFASEPSSTCESSSENNRRRQPQADARKHMISAHLPSLLQLPRDSFPAYGSSRCRSEEPCTRVRFSPAVQPQQRDEGQSVGQSVMLFRDSFHVGRQRRLDLIIISTLEAFVYQYLKDP